MADHDSLSRQSRQAGANQENKQEKKQIQRVVVEIFGDSYPLRTDDPEHLKVLARGLDRLMKRTAGHVKSFDGTKIAVLSALELADEYDKLKKDYDDLVELLDEK